MIRFAFISSLLAVYLAITSATAASKTVELPDQLIAQANQLKSLHKKLQSVGQQPSLIKDYLQIFPRDAQTFNQLFNHPEQSPLFDGNPYILKLEYLVEQQPLKVIELLIELAGQVDAKSAAGEHLQIVFMKIMINYSNQFAQIFNRLKENKKQAVIQFMLNGKTATALGYTTLIHILQRTQHAAIAKQMETALSNK